MSKGDFQLIRGDDAIIPWEIKLANGTPVDLTGCTAFITLKPELTDDLTDSTAVIKCKVYPITNPTLGKVNFPLSSDSGADASTYDTIPGNYFYDVQIKTGTGLIFSQGWRKCSVVADVTRRIT